MGEPELLAVMERLTFVLLLASCAPPAAEARVDPVAVELPSARVIADAGPPERAPRGNGKGGFLSGMAFKSAKVQNAKVGAEAVKMAAELDLADGSGRCPSGKELVDGKKLDPKGRDDPWGNPFRIVCDESGAHAISNGRDGIDNTPDDIRDDATESDLKRISEL